MVNNTMTKNEVDVIALIHAKAPVVFAFAP